MSSAHNYPVLISVESVKQSKNPCLIGVSGIVILESENAFKVITKDNRVKCKRIFCFTLCDIINNRRQ